MINEEEIIAALKPILEDYAVNRKMGERFGDFVIRIGYVKEVTEGKYFHE